jgi:hypothetical protein
LQTEVEAKLNNEENQWSRMRRGDGGDFACCIPERLSYTAFVAVWARFVPSLPSSALQQLRGYVRLLPVLSPISITLFIIRLRHSGIAPALEH